MQNKLIAIDFDGTITHHDTFPTTGQVRPEAVKYIKLLHDKGYILSLWTCRQGRYLNEALIILKQHDILKYFTYVNNDNSGQNTRKIIADFYIDDRSYLGAEIDWKNVYDYIVTNI